MEGCGQERCTANRTAASRAAFRVRTIMMEQLYYKLTDAEQILQMSRDTLLRLHRAGLVVLHGENHGRCVTGISLRALAARIEQGEDIWAVLKAIEAARESPEPFAPKRTAKGRSTRTNAAS